MSHFCKPTVVCSQSRAIKEQQCITLNSFTAFVTSLKSSLVHCCTYTEFIVVDVFNSLETAIHLRLFKFSYDIFMIHL